MTTDWPFDNDPGSFAYTLLAIVEGELPIRLVYHDPDDESWHFLHDGGPISDTDGIAAELAEVVNLDSSLYELADLPVGWCAWRPTASSPWQRYKRVDDSSPS